MPTITVNAIGLTCEVPRPKGGAEKNIRTGDDVRYDTYPPAESSEKRDSSTDRFFSQH